MPKASAEKEWKFTMLPRANVFHPTLEEFANPLKYISSIREVAKTTGMRPRYKYDLTQYIRLYRLDFGQHTPLHEM